MSKKRIKKQKETDPKSKEEQKPNSQHPTEDAEEKPFDFGGLPSRDLKKNLGCG
jgi:hypothetical protein